MTWTVEVIRYGTQQVPGAQVFHQADWESWQTFDFFVLLLTGPDGVVLIDCGMDDPAPLNHAIEANIGARGCIHHVATGGLVTDLLHARGIAPADVDVVAVTHLHADHAGNLPLFPSARIALGRRGWEAHQRRRKSHPFLVGAPAFPAQTLSALDSAAGDGRLLLAEDGAELLSGLRATTIGGHTDDSTAYVVDSAVGHLVVPGDTIWTYKNLERDIPVGSHVDVPACYDAMAWARSAGDAVLPSHDPLVTERFPALLASGSR